MTRPRVSRSHRIGMILLSFALFPGVFVASPAQEADLSEQMPEGEGKSYVQTLCTPCHGLMLTVSQRMSREGWEGSVYDMLGRLSPGLDQEAEIIIDYLVEHFGLEPAAAHDQDRTEAAAASPIRAYHQVLFNFTDEATEQDRRMVMETGRDLFAANSLVITGFMGRVTPGDTEFRYGFVTGFESEADLAEFRIHPDYRSWLQETFRPNVSKSRVTEIISAE